MPNSFTFSIALVSSDNTATALSKLDSNGKRPTLTGPCGESTYCARKKNSQARVIFD